VFPDEEFFSDSRGDDDVFVQLSQELELPDFCEIDNGCRVWDYSTHSGA